MLAATWGINKLRAYLYGHPFTLITDHKPITYLLHRIEGSSDMHQRWQMQLQEYTFTVIHRAGKNHANADIPSRYPLQLLGDSTGAQLDPLSTEEMQRQLETYSAESKQRQSVQQRWADNRTLYADKAITDGSRSAIDQHQNHEETEHGGIVTGHQPCGSSGSKNPLRRRAPPS